MEKLLALKEYQENSLYITIWINFDGEKSSYSGYLISVNQEIIVLKVIDDWHEDGVVAFPYHLVSIIERNEHEIVAEKILEKQNVSPENRYEWLITKNMRSLISSIQKNRNNIAVEYDDSAVIGRIISVSEDIVEIIGFDSNARWIDEIFKIKIEDIFIITFADEYSDIMRSYIDQNFELI